MIVRSQFSTGGSHRSQSYWMLVASLPSLPRWRVLSAYDGRTPTPPLPIGRERLQSRLAMLSATDGKALADTRALLSGPAPQTLEGGDRGRSSDEDRNLLIHAHHLQRRHRQPEVADVVNGMLEQRLPVAALRSRQRHPQDGADRLRDLLHSDSTGPPPPHADTLLRRWDEPDFGLGHVLPWLPQARALMQQDDALGLARLLDGGVWRLCDRLRARERFGFPAVLAYCIQWDLAERWQSLDASHAQACLVALLSDLRTASMRRASDEAEPDPL